MDGTGTPTMRIALLGALILSVFVGLVAFAVRSAPDPPAPAPVAPTIDAPPTPHPPRVRPPKESASMDPPPHAVRVAVTSMDGTPIAGARVELFRGPDVDEWIEQEPHRVLPSAEDAPPERSAECDGDGTTQFDELPNGRWFVVANAPGFGRYVVGGLETRDSTTALAAAVALASGRPLAGRVFDEGGNPAAGRRVVLASQRMYTQWFTNAQCVRTVSAADGGFRFDSVAPGDYVLFYSPRPGVVVGAERFRFPAIDVVDIHEVRGGTIEGTVREADSDDSVVGANVHLVADSGDRSTYDLDVAQSDAQGHFALRTWRTVCTPTHLYVEDARHAPQPTDSFPTMNGFSEGQHVDVSVRVRRAARWRGSMCCAVGPIPRTLIRAHFDGAPGACDVRTDAAGRFDFDRLPPGSIFQVALPEWSGLGFQRFDEPLALAAGDTLEHDVRLDPSLGIHRVRVSGRVVGEDGSPVAGVDVTESNRTPPASARTAADGRFAIDATFAQGGVGLFARRDGFAIERFGADGPDVGDVTLQRLATRSGTVRDAGGNPVAGARVAALLPEARWEDETQVRWSDQAETVTASDGTYRLTAGVGVEARSAVDGATSVSATDAGDIVLPAARRVAGRVAMAGTGAPVAGVGVRRRGVLLGRTDDDGRFAVDLDGGAAASLEFDRADLLDAEATIGAGDVLVEMRRALTIAGIVRRADGAPVAERAVVAFAVGATGVSDDAAGLSTTDAKGRFVLHWLASGAYLVRVDDPDADSPVETRATAGQDDLVVVLPR